MTLAVLETQKAKRGGLLREHGLTVALLVLFVGSMIGQIVAGHAVYIEEARAHGEPAISLGRYLVTGHFVEAVFENWESEFLQMAIFVLLTKWLRQRGSSESKKFDEEDAADEDPREHRHEADVPWPVRKGGFVLALYERSLSLALLLLFVLAFSLHAAGGARAYSLDQVRHGEPPVGVWEYLGSSQFWFESFQNWQSEFLSIALVIVLSIYLRERGSSQSKRVAAPHHETGE